MVARPGNLANYKGKTRGGIYSVGNESLYKDNARMRIILLGPPGSGKSVISRKIADKYGLSVVSVEEVAEELSAMAQQEDELGRLARDAIGSGRVSDDVCNIVIRRVLGKDEFDSGFVLVGYPKDVAQAEFMEQALNQMRRPLDLVLMIDIDRDELMERRVGRIDCDACGTHYNLYVNPPLVEGVCDMCGSRVSRRPRGYEENISNQLREYDVAVRPVLDFYQGLGKLRLVDANGTEDELWEGVQKIIDNTTPVVLEPLAGQAEEKEETKTPASPRSEGKKPAKAVSAVNGEEAASVSARKKAVKKAPARKAAVKKKKTVKKKAAKKAVTASTGKKKAVKKTPTKKKVVKKAARKVMKKSAAASAGKKKVVKKTTAKKKVVKKAVKKKVAKKVTKKTATKKAAATRKKLAASKKVARKKVVKKAAGKKKVAKKKPVGKKTVKKSAVKKVAGRKKAVKKAPVRKKAVKKAPAKSVKKVAGKTVRKKAVRKKR